MIRIPAKNLRILLPVLCIALMAPGKAFPQDRAPRVSVSSGSWNDPATWQPAGIPAAGDDVVIRPGHLLSVDHDASARSLAVESTAGIVLDTSVRLTLTGRLEVDGTFDMNAGDVTAAPGLAFVLGAGSTFTWNPGTNTASGASLFIQGEERFDPASTLIIRQWYDPAQVPLGAVVSGSFGNVVLNSRKGNILAEWNQDNQFEQHPVMGQLKVDEGWIVLDKSGRIHDTRFGGIVLAGPNAYLDFHNGTHPGDFTVTAGTVENNGGHLNGIYNGNGNVNLVVLDRFSNYGHVVLIYNTGVAGTGEGHAALDVGGTYFQANGDFRGIFNLTSFHAGTVDLAFGNAVLSGGIFIGQYACHRGTGTNTFRVRGNLNIVYASALSVFRVTGLTALAGTFNTASTEIDVAGNMLVDGSTDAEVTGSGGVGGEAVTVHGDLFLKGSAVNFNMGSHATRVSVGGSVTIAGGTHCFSRTPGRATVDILGSVSVTGGNVSLKGNTGPGNLTIRGGFDQSGGNAFLHRNEDYTSEDTLSWTVHGDFAQHGGSLNLDDNPATRSVNRLLLAGRQVTLGGHASILQASGTGWLTYCAMGTIQYGRESNEHLISGIRQVIGTGCTLKVIAGNLQIASSRVPAETDMLVVRPRGALVMGPAKIVSNLLFNHTGLVVLDEGRLSTQCPNGLYNGTEQACINATGNVSYFLGIRSIVEYNGSENQVVTGISTTAHAEHNKYGILEINIGGTTTGRQAMLDGATVHVRTRLRLTRGELYLNNFPVTIESGDAGAIERVEGYIRSDNHLAANEGYVRWMNLGEGTHEYPFGTDPEHYLPVSFTPVSGMGRTVSISTRSTGPDNQPYPANHNPVTGIIRDGTDISVSSVIDRWWDIDAPGYVAHVTLTYRGSENTTADSLAGTAFSVQSWNGYGWGASYGLAKAAKRGTGQIEIRNMNRFSHWILSTPTGDVPVNDFLQFEAVRVPEGVSLSWTVPAGSGATQYAVERCGDNEHFETIRTVQAQPAAEDVERYRETDGEPLPGISYYRIRRDNRDGTSVFSHTERIEIVPETVKNLQILAVTPNPFDDRFTVTYFSDTAGDLSLTLSDGAGKTVERMRIRTAEGANAYTVREKGNLTPGIYVLTLICGESKTSRKLFKD